MEYDKKQLNHLEAPLSVKTLNESSPNVCWRISKDQQSRAASLITGRDGGGSTLNSYITADPLSSFKEEYWNT